MYLWPEPGVKYLARVLPSEGSTLTMRLLCVDPIHIMLSSSTTSSARCSYIGLKFVNY